MVGNGLFGLLTVSLLELLHTSFDALGQLTIEESGKEGLQFKCLFISAV
jgi:hypothetical protein